MSSNAKRGIFRVEAHFEIGGFGAVVAGVVIDGVVEVGMVVTTGPSKLTVTGVEYADNVTERVSKNALLFAEKPALDLLRTWFPVGSDIETTDANEAAR